MNGDLWLNLPSKNLNKAREFFTKLGFEMNERHKSPEMLSMFVGNKKIVVNLFPEALFKSFSQITVTNTTQSSEVMFSLGAATRAEVDAMAKKAQEAGGDLFAKPGDKDGWMYGCGFADLVL